jgi:hypothetical protein
MSYVVILMSFTDIFPSIGYGRTEQFVMLFEKFSNIYYSNEIA